MNKPAEQARQHEQEIEDARDAVKLNPEDAELRFQLGLVLHKAHQTEAAAVAFGECLTRLDDEPFEVSKRMGKTLFELGRLDDAERFLDPIADRAEDPKIYECLLAINTERNRPLDNLPILKKLAALKPEESTYLVRQIGINLDHDQPADALETFKALPEQEQQQVHNQYVLGVIHVQLKEHGKAIEVLEGVVRRDPEHAEAKQLLDSLKMQSTSQAAGSAVSPEETKRLIREIGINLDNGQPAKALEAFAALPEQERQRVHNQYVLGVIHFQLKQLGKAIEVLEGVISREPKHREAKQLLESLKERSETQADTPPQSDDFAHQTGDSGTAGSMLRANSAKAPWNSVEHESIVSLRNVGLRYGRILGLGSRQPSWSLRNLDLDIYEGETLGIVGSNGAGKTTLMRVLADLIKPDEGRIDATCGRRMMLSISMGFVPTISGRKNIMLYGLLLGESLLAVKMKLESIIAFSELEEAIDDPVYTYSLGMRARLGFAIAFSAEPDLLLIDEVLGVGDQAFGQKSYEALRRRLEANKTAVLTTHNDIFIRNLCDRAVWLQDGRIKMVGLPNDVVDEYQRSMQS